MGSGIRRGDPSGGPVWGSVRGSVGDPLPDPLGDPFWDSGMAPAKRNPGDFFNGLANKLLGQRSHKRIPRHT